jgi:transcriptional regulator with XRE-family HTH domain
VDQNETQGFRELLAAAVEMSQVPAAEIEEWAEVKAGSLGRMIEGKSEIPVDKLLLILQCIALHPADFFDLGALPPARGKSRQEQIRAGLGEVGFGPLMTGNLSEVSAAAILKQLLLLVRLSHKNVQEIEEELGWSKGTLSRLKSGRSQPTLRQLAALLAALGLSLRDLGDLLFPMRHRKRLRRPARRLSSLDPFDSGSLLGRSRIADDLADLDARLDRLDLAKLDADLDDILEEEE